MINEDVLARLKAAEDEAARLRKELAAAQKQGAPSDVIESKPARIDSTDKRETLFTVSNKERASWLSEKDVDFFVGNGVGETSSNVAPVSDADQQVITKRLLIGGLLTLGVAAFAMVPTESLRLKPPKPMYFYVVPLLRSKDLLEECKPIIEDGNWSGVRVVLQRVVGQPNNIQENLGNVVALIEDGKTKTKAAQLSAEFYEYLDSIDYNRYFDAMPTKTISGAQAAQFVDFSSKALKAAQSRLDAFLALLPAQVIEDARATMNVY